MKKFLIITLTIFCGCSYSTYYLQTGAKSYPATKFGDIKFYSGKPQQTFTVLGSVATWAQDKETAKTLLREKAASLGADAVIYIELTTLQTNSGGVGMNGVAVTFSH